MVLPELQQMGLKIKAVAEALYGVQHYRVLYAVQTPPTPKSGLAHSANYFRMLGSLFLQRGFYVHEERLVFL